MTFATDKDRQHGYMPDYRWIAGELGPAAVVCEVGVDQGLSLEMWQALFPQGVVIGADHAGECRWPPGTRKIISAQDDPDLAGKVRQAAPDGCNLIVDDASHLGHLSAATFEILWPLVLPDGFYVVEDWADPWVFPGLMRWPDVDPQYAGDELVDFVPSLVTALRKGAGTVTYTYEGLVIIRRKR